MPLILFLRSEEMKSITFLNEDLPKSNSNFNINLTFMSLINISAIALGEKLYNDKKSGISKLMRSKVF